MKYILLAFAAIFLTIGQSQAQSPPECLARYGSQPGGKACCNASYAKAGPGSMRNAERASEIQACIAKRGKR